MAPARIVGWDLFNDTGVIRVEPDEHALSALPLGDSAAVSVGEPVAAIGSPFGNQNSLAVGVISATRRTIPPSPPATTSPAPSRSTRRSTTATPVARSSTLVAASSASTRRSVRLRQRRGRRLRHSDQLRAPLDGAASWRRARSPTPYIGVTTQDVTPGMARRFSLGAERGALIADVKGDTPAARRPAGRLSGGAAQRRRRDARRRPDHGDRRRAGAERGGRLANRHRTTAAGSARALHRLSRRHAPRAGSGHAAQRPAQAP